ncbi:MAG: S8 family serine peptidase [Candidatus Heimdallarchaeota archaeon]
MESAIRISTTLLSIFLFIHGSFLCRGISSSITSSDIQWHLEMVGAEAAWNYTQGSPAIVVAIIDSGIDIDHPDLFNQTWTNPGEIAGNGLDDDSNGYVDDMIGWDFRDDDNDPRPGHPHGTKVSGILVADDDNHLSVGIAPKIRIMALRFLDDNNQFAADDWDMFIDAIDYAVNNGAKIIHLSVQAIGIPPQSFHDAIERAYSNGVAIVGVTGNKLFANDEGVSYPGAYSEVIAVSAVNKTKGIAFFSLTGDQNEICAPGQDIPTIIPDSPDIVLGIGTSFAAPLVSGTIALMLSLNSTLSIPKVREILHNTSTDLGSVGKDQDYGYGLLNVSAALNTVIREHNGTIPTFSDSIQSTKSTTRTSMVDLPPFGMILLVLTVLTFIGKRNGKY